MFLGHDYLDSQRLTESPQADNQDSTPRYIDPSQLIYDPTYVSTDRQSRLTAEGPSSNDMGYPSSSVAHEAIPYPQASDASASHLSHLGSIDPQLLLPDEQQGATDAAHSTPADDWRHPSNSFTGLHAPGGPGSGYEYGAGPPQGYGFLPGASPNHVIGGAYPGQADMGGVYPPLAYQQNIASSYLADPFLYATPGQQVDDGYGPHSMVGSPSQTHFSRQLHDLDPNHLDPYGDRDGSLAPKAKKARPEKIRTAKPLTEEDLVHDDSRFARVVRAYQAIENVTERTVPEISKMVEKMNPGKYADFEAVKRMVNDVLQKHKAFYHNGRGSPYYMNLQEGRARREFPSNARHSHRHGMDRENVAPRFNNVYGRRPTRFSRRHRAQDLHVMTHMGEDPNTMGMTDYMHGPMSANGYLQHDEPYIR